MRTQFFQNSRFSASPLNTWLIAATLVITLTAAVLLYRPPWPVGDDAPLDAFSAERAMTHVLEIGREPHPYGSPAHAKVKAYIRSTLRELSLEPFELESPPRAFSPAGPVIDNIAVRLSGTDSSGAILFMAHHDSKRGAPGAADDGSGVATLLETVRAMQAGARPKNDLIFLFTDSEETGLRGARAFIEGSPWDDADAGHPWRDDVKVVLNFDGRGSRGVVMMPDSGENNGWIVSQFADAVPYPIANSLMHDVQKRMPNSSDVDPFFQHGIAGMNFNFADGYPQYHSPLDIPSSLDPATVQHMGSHAIGLARHLGDADLTSVHAGDHVYFNPAVWVFVHYPMWVNWIVLAVTLLAFAGVWLVGVRHGHVSVPAVLYGFLVSILLTLAAVAATYGLAKVLHISLGERYVWVLHETLGFYAGAAVLIYCIGLSLARTWLRAQDLTLGAVLLWLVFGTAVTIAMPGGSPLFIWPPLLLLLPLVYHFTSDDFEQVGTGSAFLFILSGVAVLLMFVPNIIAMNIAIAPIMPELAALAVLLVALVCGLLTPHFSTIIDGHRWAFPVSTLAAANIFLLIALMTAAPRDARAWDEARAWAEANTDIVIASPSVEPGDDIVSIVTAKLARGDQSDAFAQIYDRENPLEALKLFRQVADHALTENASLVGYAAAMYAGTDYAVTAAGLPDTLDPGTLRIEAMAMATAMADRLQPFAHTGALSDNLAQAGRNAAFTAVALAETPEEVRESHVRLAKYHLALRDIPAARDALKPIETDESTVTQAWTALVDALAAEEPGAQRKALLSLAGSLASEGPRSEQAQFERAVKLLVPAEPPARDETVSGASPSEVPPDPPPGDTAP